MAKAEHAKKDREYHDDIAATYDETVVQPRVVTNDYIYAKVRRLIRPGDTLLDLGCGTGHLTLRFGTMFRHVIAVDHSPEMLKQARRNAVHCEGLRADFICSDALDFIAGCDAQQFDAVGCVGFLHHLKPDDLELLLGHISQALKPKGLLILQEPIKIPPGTVPDSIAQWNGQSVVTRMSYGNTAPHPDEEPLSLEPFLQLLARFRFQTARLIRTWEIFPHSIPAPLNERIRIRFLNWRHGRRGNVCTLVARKIQI